jgi:hypothetical protein
VELSEHLMKLCTWLVRSRDRLTARSAMPGVCLCRPAEATAAAFAREITKKPREAAFFK